MRFVDLLAVIHGRPRVADQLPADHVGVAAVQRVAEHAFDGVAQQLERSRPLDRAQALVALGGRQVGEVAQPPMPSR